MLGTQTFRNRALKAVAVFLAFTLALTVFTACGKSEGDDFDPNYNIPVAKSTLGKNAKAPTAAPVFYKNNITFEQEDRYYNDDGWEVSIGRISGLKDKDVEEKINSKIEATCLKLFRDTNPPAYRGAKIETANFDKPTSLYVYSYPSANVNNILSVVINRSVTYERGEWGTDDYETHYYGDAQPLTFDLNTGEVLKLADVYANNVNCIADVNSYLRASLQKADYERDDNNFYWVSGDYLELAAPFTTINEDQKFYINEYTGGVTILLDYDTPEFYVDRYCYYYNVPYNTNMAYAEKFLSDKSLFIDENVSYILPMNLGVGSYSHMVSEVVEEEHLNIEAYITYCEGYPDEVVEKLDAYKAEMAKAYEDMKTESASLFNEYGKDNVWYNGEYSVNANLIGSKYYTISVGDYRNASFLYGTEYYDMNDDPLIQRSDYTFNTYEFGREEPLELSDIFKEGFDYRQRFLDLQLEALKNQFNTAYGKYDKEEAKAFLEALYEHVCGYSLNQEGLWLRYDVDVDVFAGEYFGIGDDEENAWLRRWNYASPTYNTYDYNKFGFENLNIF